MIGKRQFPTFALHSTADVDEVKMYNRQLSAQEIENMYSVAQTGQNHEDILQKKVSL